jgi:hypothetical protein
LTHLLFFFFCPASSSSSGLKPEFLQARKPIFHNLLYFIYRWANPAETEILKKIHLIWKIGASIILLSLYFSGWIEKNV